MRRAAFTLVELLVVLGIVAIASALALSVPTADNRLGAVDAAARELGATLRVARSLALERQAVYGVAFNIQNGAGTSGSQINNWDGEHWYRIIGPSLESNAPAPPDPTRLNTSYGTAYNVVKVVRGVSRSWVGEPHRLAARKVRFLALSDQDNGHSHTWDDGATQYGTFPSTYPRPWCGWWDGAANRLRPWGGYDPALVDGAGRKNSAFYYEGQDGAITGCLTPAAKTRTSTLTKTEMGNESTADNASVLLAGGAPRPLVNGNWLDCQVLFYPDGHVQIPGFMDLRYWSRRTQGAGGGNAVPGYGDLGDLYPPCKSLSNHRLHERPATWFQEASGYWYFTLAPDLQQDSDVFPNVQAALKSLQPCMRVGINPVGDVRVVQVRTALSPTLPDGTTVHLDNSITSWSDPVQTKAKYARNMLSDANGKLRGAPITDSLTVEMLSQRSWWYAP